MRIPRTNYFISQVLPGGGTFLVGGTFEFPWGTNVITFYITYTRGAANGQPQFQVEIGNGVELCRTTIVDSSSLAISAPNASVDIYLERVDGPAPADANAICYILRVCPQMGERTIRLSARELGVVGSPGTIAAVLTGGGPEQ